MIVIPAIDLKDGQCVRLKQGKFDHVTVFGDDPPAIARRWESLGAEWLHVVDLDGAVGKSPKNREAIRQIIDSINIPVEVGGGIRGLETVDEYIGMGVERVILGTVALKNPELVEEASNKYPGKVAVGIDAKSGKVAVEGWTEVSNKTPIEIAKSFSHLPLAAIIYTDIQRDGMQTGVNIEGTKALAEAIDIPVIASGGVATLDDIRALLPLERAGVIGVITGRAIYAGTLDLVEAIALAKNPS
ncbi:MAG TPA: 1-(5-phosphoribosyl)-5-[(5-phosphoribosylamino)methylideneamino]imidazole-4-carboxamide isomerase [Deltaproteobacteria bacterium]|nr:1-(5-phosphoribosyl)-5-[(5-phosphoribosylamino)methylideneamino]imidazole-4-carboxamide isomerase [Deltaproteobacteria bacterium]